MLQTRTTLVVALLFCAYFAVAKLVAALRVGGQSVFDVPERDPWAIFWAALSAFIAACIATKSPVIGDRVVFGLGAVAFAWKVLREVFLPADWLISAMSGLLSLSWAVAAVFILMLAVRTSGPRPGREEPLPKAGGQS